MALRGVLVGYVVFRLEHFVCRQIRGSRVNRVGGGRRKGSSRARGGMGLLQASVPRNGSLGVFPRARGDGSVKRRTLCRSVGLPACAGGWGHQDRSAVPRHRSSRARGGSSDPSSCPLGDLGSIARQGRGNGSPVQKKNPPPGRMDRGRASKRCGGRVGSALREAKTFRAGQPVAPIW